MGTLLVVSELAAKARRAVNDLAAMPRPLLIMHGDSKTEICSGPWLAENERLNLTTLTGFAQWHVNILFCCEFQRLIFCSCK